MTTTSTPTGHHPTAAPPPPATSQAAVRRAAVVAGGGLVLMAVLAGFGSFVAVEGLVTRGDAARTVVDVAAALGTFRLGVAALLGVVVLDVVVAWALLVFFRPVDRRLSGLAAGFRLVYSAVFLAAIVPLAAVPGLVESGGASAGAEVLRRVDTFDQVWSAGLFLFGAHLLLVGLLAHRSGYVPRLLAALVAVAGAGYVLDSLTTVLTGGSFVTVSTVTFVGEPLLAVWLLVRGRRVDVEEVRS